MVVPPLIGALKIFDLDSVKQIRITENITLLHENFGSF